MQGSLKHKPSVRQLCVDDSSDTNHPKKAMIRAVKYDVGKQLENRIKKNGPKLKTTAGNVSEYAFIHSFSK